MLTKKIVMCVLLAGIAAFAVPMTAMATYQMVLSDGTTTYTIADNGLGDSDSTLGAISVNLSSLPAFAFEFTGISHTSFSNAPGSAAASSILDVTWSNIVAINKLGGTLTVQVTDTGFTFPSSNTAAILESIISGNGSSTGTWSVTGHQFVKDSAGGILANAGQQGPFSYTPGGFTNGVTAQFTSLTPYTIEDDLTLTLSPNASTTGDFKSEVTSVPEPVTLLMLGLGLVGTGVVARKRTKK